MSNVYKGESKTFFTWEHKVEKDYTYSCAKCKFNEANKCNRRAEMNGKTLPTGSEPVCGFGVEK